MFAAAAAEEEFFLAALALVGAGLYSEFITCREFLRSSPVPRIRPAVGAAVFLGKSLGVNP